jgi:hypothetical protein
MSRTLTDEEIAAVGRRLDALSTLIAAALPDDARFVLSVALPHTRVVASRSPEVDTFLMTTNSEPSDVEKILSKTIRAVRHALDMADETRH